MYACMEIYMNVADMHVYMHGCMYACICMLYECIHLGMYTGKHTHVCMCVGIYVCMWGLDWLFPQNDLFSDV